MAVAIFLCCEIVGRHLKTQESEVERLTKIVEIKTDA